MPPQPRNDYSDLATIIQAAINPMVAKMQTLENKVDELSRDRATRSDIEKLRIELVGSFVPRDAYEPRHAALVERDVQIEGMVREVRRDLMEEVKDLHVEIEKQHGNVEMNLQKIHDRLESGKQQLEDRIKQQSDAQLSLKDRAWIRWSQFAGFVGIALAVLDWLSQHIKFN